MLFLKSVSIYILFEKFILLSLDDYTMHYRYISLTLTSSLINGDISDPNLAHTDADPKAIFRTTVGNTSLENI